jgi:hypothetical protein
VDGAIRMGQRTAAGICEAAKLPVPA